MNFYQWLAIEGKSDSTILKYIGALNGRLSTWAHQHVQISSRIGSIYDPAEFAALSVKLQLTQEYVTCNKKGHGMYGAALMQYQRYLDYVNSAEFQSHKDGPYIDELAPMTAQYIGFVPNSVEDGRRRVLKMLVERRGQPKFRRELIKFYYARCAITGSTVLPILEAAHITPYLGISTNEVSNGLLLRADVHTLWDLGLIAVEPDSLRVRLSSTVNDPDYVKLAGKILTRPNNGSADPSPHALSQHSLNRTDRIPSSMDCRLSSHRPYNRT
jgi:hypothetical protein